ncbi:embryo-specific protein ATS3B-like [Phaseolus vulgaris]|uniref:embryo-specific protein ATS3B-like n=1 Tax=Phaseolus vulgaris TaxID=3885 RepID=UPI0035CC36C9
MKRASEFIILFFLKHKTMNALNWTIILAICIIFAFSSHATPNVTRSEAMRSSKLNQTQHQMNECSYVVNVETSCSSSFYARGKIDVLFGDAIGNEVYVPQLHGPFEDCTMNIYDIYGALCSTQICRLHIYWSGDGGLILEKVSIHSNYYDPVTFYYHTYIPEGGFYGFDYCHYY